MDKGGAEKQAPDDGRMRVAKAIARAGLCSRRDAEVWIAAGRVAVNGKIIDTPATIVGPSDRIVVDGEPLPDADAIRLWRYHKPEGLVTSHKDTRGRPTVFEALPDNLPRVISVGRLDMSTEGLMLLTNSGALARHLELPATGWLRRYRVRAHGQVTDADLDRIRQGAEIDGVRYGPVEAKLDRPQGSNVWLTLGLREGKNREVKNLLGALGLSVNRLIRISFGPFQLGDLAVRAIEEVKTKTLRDQLGPRLSQELGLETPHKAARRASAAKQPVGERPQRKDAPPSNEKARPPRTAPMRARKERPDNRGDRAPKREAAKETRALAKFAKPERPKPRPGGIRGGPRTPKR